jgi:predicted CoA-binding protein
MRRRRQCSGRCWKRSVAIAGASTRPGSFGNALVRQVLPGGFAGSVQPVNPRYREVEGLRCVPSLADLPQPAELALVAVGPDRVEAQLQAAADAGTRAAVVYTSLPGADLNARLQAVAAGAGWPCAGQTEWGLSTSNVRCGRAPINSRATSGPGRSRSSATPVRPFRLSAQPPWSAVQPRGIRWHRVQRHHGQLSRLRTRLAIDPCHRAVHGIQP